MGKLMMFGKSHNTVGDHEADLCLCTAGDITVKTAGRFVPIFKSGKLAVNNSSEIFVVDSEEAMKKDGVYLVQSTQQSGEPSNSVFLYADGIKILLTSEADGYISYTAAQNLKPEQFIQALSNLGVYFKTIEDAKASSITEGLVYILGEQKLYKLVNGDFVEIAASNSDQSDSSATNSSPTDQKGLTQLQIGGIFIDGEANTISAESGLKLQVDGVDYLWVGQNKVFVKQDLVLDRQKVFMIEGSEKGKSGMLIYFQDGESYLEVDNLLVRNTSAEYEPQLYTTYIGTSTKNQVKTASWSTAPTDISMALKYRNNFAVDDYVLVQSTSSNKLTVEAESDRVGTADGNTKLVQQIIATLASAPLQEVVLKITYEYPVDENTSNTGTADITIPVQRLNEDTGSMEPNTYGESAKIEDISLIDRITSVEILSGDSDIYYGDSGNSVLPTSLIGTVTSLDPLTIHFPTQANPANSILSNLKNSPIYKIGSPKETSHILYHSGNSISLKDCTVKEGALVQTTTTQIGDLGSIQKPKQTENFTGNGIYSDNLVGVSPQFYGGTFEGGIDYPRYGKSLKLPSDAFDDPTYDTVIPCIGWVKELIRVGLNISKSGSSTQTP